MRSDDVDCHFHLMNGLRGEDWWELMGNDDNGAGGPDSWGCHYLRPGIYTIVATSSAYGAVGDTGSYTLSVHRSTEDHIRRISLILSRGVSLVAYQAGAVEEILYALDHLNGSPANNGPNSCPFDVTFTLL